MTYDELDAERVRLFGAYSRGRKVLTLRQLLAQQSEWPDRPVRIPEDFDELHLAAIADELRAVVASYLAERGETIEQHVAAHAERLADDADGAAWGSLGSEHDVDSVLDYIDQTTLDTVRDTACAVVRQLRGAS